jgi:plastocyanin
MSGRVLVLVALAATVLPSSTARADDSALTGSVGKNEAFVISLLDASGNPVKHLDPGTYTIQVHDFSILHNFHLFGPGVAQATEIGTTSDPTWTVDFQNGIYTYRCDAHSSTMIGQFTVGTIRTVKLTAAVGPGKTIFLRDSTGARVTALSGPVNAVITVNDRSRVDNFHLSGPGVNKRTGVGFRGHVTWHFTLTAGKYVYRSDKHKTLRGSFSITAG